MYSVHEEQRLKSLLSLEVLDTPREPEFDELVQLAAAICATPISLITLVDDRRQWFKAAIGLEVRETPREVAFCAHSIQQTGMFVVEDAAADERFAMNPLVTGDPYIRFYAGMPVHTPDGMPMGTLCVIDRVARKLSSDQLSALQILAQQVNSRLELRVQRKALETALRTRDEVAAGLRASEERFRSFMTNSPFASYIKDAHGHYLFYNRRAARAFQVEGDQLLGRRDVDWWPAPIAERIRLQDEAVLASGQPTEITERISGADGRLQCWRVIKFPLLDSSGTQVLGTIAVDETEAVERKLEVEAYQAMLEEANNRLRSLAVTDGLTGLRNRRAFDERLSIEFSMARRRGRALSVALIDADDFKQINDKFGHAEGDAVLRKLGEILEQTVRLPDLAARYGGEEFAVLLPETDGPNAYQWARRLMDALAAVELPHARVTVSIGISTLSDAAVNGAHLVRMADEALYGAKRGGKNQAVSYPPAAADPS